MSLKRATYLAIGIVAALALFVVLFLFYLPRERDQFAEPPASPAPRGLTQNEMAQKPVTPDSVTDTIESQSQDDAAAFDAAESDEKDSITAGGESVNNLSTVYDANEN